MKVDEERASFRKMGFLWWEETRPVLGTKGLGGWTQRAREVRQERWARPDVPDLPGHREDFGLDFKRNGKPVMCLKQGRRGDRL